MFAWTLASSESSVLAVFATHDVPGPDLDQNLHIWGNALLDRLYLNEYLELRGRARIDRYVRLRSGRRLREHSGCQCRKWLGQACSGYLGRLVGASTFLPRRGSATTSPQRKHREGSQDDPLSRLDPGHRRVSFCRLKSLRAIAYLINLNISEGELVPWIATPPFRPEVERRQRYWEPAPDDRDSEH